MKVVVQRVKRASVSGKINTQILNISFLYFWLVSEEIVGKIDAGLCLLVGLTHDDTEKELQEL